MVGQSYDACRPSSHVDHVAVFEALPHDGCNSVLVFSWKDRPIHLASPYFALGPHAHQRGHRSFILVAVF